jgi:circadian clock protein KaiC
MSADHPVPALDCWSTGSPAFDHLLGGGIPTRSVLVIAGEPGAGKTILTLQLLFHRARQGQHCLYFTTLSEPALKLIRYTQLFDFFAPQLLDEQLRFADLGATLRAQGAAAALAEVSERVAAAEPDLVAIDSFKVLHDLLGGPATSRAWVYDLAVQLAGWGATTLLVGEYAPEELLTLPEFAIADGILRLTNERHALTSVRMLEVHKLRGAAYVSGRHFFEITRAGLAVYPRVRTPEVPDAPAPASTRRVASGVAGLDALLHGGVPEASATLVQGGSGTGKTLLGLEFLVHGAQRGEPGLLLTLEEMPAQLRGIAATLGWDLAALEAAGRFQLHYTSPVELSPDRFLDQARQRAAALGAQRVVLDGVSTLALGVGSERRLRELIYALSKHLRLAGVTFLLTMEVAELLGTTQLTGHGVSSLADNVILLRYVEVAGQLERALSILKVRGSAHETAVHHWHIAAGGSRVGEPFHALQGVLTGLPRRAE